MRNNKAKEPKADIKCEVKAILHESSGKNKTQLRIVHWIVDGVDKGAKLEKRSFFKKKDGSFSEMGTCKGLSGDDLDYIVSNWVELKMFF